MLRVCIFKDRPESALIHVSDGYSGPVPALVAPFCRQSVREACRAAGQDVTVIETVPGRWSAAINAAKSAEAQRASAEAALRTQAMLGSVDPKERDRAKLVARLQAIPAEQREVRSKIREATARAARGGGHMDRTDWGRLQDREAQLREETAAIHAQLSKMKADARAGHDARQRTFAERFVALAKDSLDRETFLDLCDAAQAQVDDAADGEGS